MKQYCKRGHDTDVVGRTQRMCRECRRANDRARYARSTSKRKAQGLAWYIARGYLRQLNLRVNSALENMGVHLGR